MNFPRNLYENRGYFSWRHPQTGEYFGLGKDRAKAFEEALEANLRIAKPRERLVDRITHDGRTVAKWEEKHQALIGKRELTKGTRSNYLAYSRRMVKMLGADTPLRSVTALNISEGLDGVVSEGLAKVAQQFRSYLRQSFELAISHGWVDANPVRITVIQSPPVARARLSLDVFMRVYESAPTEWLRNAMALALVSAQRREDVATAQFKDFHDGGWWLTQASEKTDHPHRIFIPNDLKPMGFHSCLGDVVNQARRTGVVSRFVVHQTGRRKGRSSLGRELRLSTVSSAFTSCVEALGIDWGANTPPTFHEIRSLALRLYGEQGVNAQLLAGHTDPDTTSIYLNSRGTEYVKVTV